MRLHLRYAPRYTHEELVSRALTWLQRSQRCVALWSKQTVLTPENPDAIGWTPGGNSVVIECKASRSDFKRDEEKPHRDGPGMGNIRYFLASQGVLSDDVMPEGWGLLECSPARITVRHPATIRGHEAKDWQSEMRLLVRAARVTPLEPFTGVSHEASL